MEYILVLEWTESNFLRLNKRLTSPLWFYGTDNFDVAHIQITNSRAVF